MGGEQSTTAIKTQQQFQSFMIQYSQERDYAHPQFGHIKLYTHNQSNDTILLKKFNTKSTQELDTLASHLKRRKTYDQFNLFKLIAVRTNQDSQFCSDASQVIVISECYLDNLENELQQRMRDRQQYPESHLWILIQQIVDPCAYLEDKKQVHGDIRPCNIFLDQNGMVKLAEFNMLPGNQPGFQKLLFCKDKVYLSPILLKAYSEENFRPTHNQPKSDVYSFGLTLLHVILLEDSFDCFDYSSGNVLQDAIDEKINRLKQQGYSQLLINFIRELLQYAEELRPSWNELRTVIEEFRSQIINMIPFYNQNNNIQSQENVMVISKAILNKPQIVNFVQPLAQSILTRSPQRVLQFSPQRRMNQIAYKASPSTQLQSEIKQSKKL